MTANRQNCSVDLIPLLHEAHFNKAALKLFCPLTYFLVFYMEFHAVINNLV